MYLQTLTFLTTAYTLCLKIQIQFVFNLPTLSSSHWNRWADIPEKNTRRSNLPHEKSYKQTDKHTDDSPEVEVGGGGGGAVCGKASGRSAS